MMEVCHTEISFHAICRPSNTCFLGSPLHVRLVLVRPELEHWYNLPGKM